MAQHFDWRTNGLDKARFESLTKLLRLRYNGQVEASTRFDEAQFDAIAGYDGLHDETDSIKATKLVEFDTGSLQRAFLDRLAELVANEKGGRHVAATLMIADHDGTRVFVSRNSKFRPRDEKFLKQTEELLRLVAEDKSQYLPTLLDFCPGPLFRSGWFDTAPWATQIQATKTRFGWLSSRTTRRGF